MAMKYMMTYYDSLPAVRLLSDSEKGRLFLALLEYGNRNNIDDYQPPNFPGRENFLFEMLKAQMDRDNEKYKKQCEINKENGKYGSLGGRPRKNTEEKPKRVLKTPKKEKEKEEENKKEKDKEKKKDKEKEEEKENFHCAQQNGTSPEQMEDVADRFERFYREYPKKKNKGKAYRWFVQHQPSSELVDEMVAFLKVAKQTIDWLKSGGKYIPHPATWLNAKGWENEINPSEIADISEKSPSFLLAKILYEKLRDCKLEESEIKNHNIFALLSRWAVVIDEYLSSERTPQREDKVYSAIQKFTKNNYWKNIIVDAESLIKNINYIK